MGMGGYFCHSRTGLITEYLGEEWFELISICAEYGAKHSMETWLYDEDRWPSGIAGGRVTKNPEYRRKYLRLTICEKASFIYKDDMFAVFSANVDGLSFCEKKRILKGEEASGSHILYFTVAEMEPQSFYNGYTYADTMNPDAVKAFIRETHEKYKEKCGNSFKYAEGIFTDEPHRGAVMCGFSLTEEEPFFITPYTDSLFSDFKDRFGYDLLEYLPELFLFKDATKIHPVKWHYMELLQSLFIEHFFKPVQDFCTKNGLKLTGHVLHEDTLTCQGSMIGSVMRAYEYMDIPGIDLLGENNNCYWIAVQLRSVARQQNKKWMLSEMYGCTGWQFSFEGHKAVGDWQALFGVNVRCHHLSWYSMKGEGKRDFPASISHQSAWYKDYPVIEDYFSRLGLLLMQGEAICDTMVVNPVESTWAVIHPGWSDNLSTNDEDIRAVENSFTSLFLKLASEKIDFDLGDEDHIARFGKIVTNNSVPYLEIGAMKYKNIVIPKMLTMRKSTLDLLKKFANSGGNVIFCGEVVSHIDCLPSGDAGRINAHMADIETVCDYIESPFAVTDIKTDKIFAAYRKTEDGTIVVLINTDRENSCGNVKITFAEEGNIEQWDVRTGEVFSLGKGKVLTHSFPPCGELVLRIAKKDNGYPKKEAEELKIYDMRGKYAYSLSEPNVCTLKRCECLINDDLKITDTDILEADNQVRDYFSLDRRGGEMVQPWFAKKDKFDTLGRVDYEFSFLLEAFSGKISLAIEAPEDFKVFLNDKQGIVKTDKYWVDSCFEVFDIPSELLKKGINKIRLSCNFREDINSEAIYLLGDFGVHFEDSMPVIKPLPNMLDPQNIEAQGFPFYGGAVRYEISSLTDENAVRFAAFDGALWKLDDGIRFIPVFTKPYIGNISGMDTKNGLTAECILTRKNTF